MCGKCPAAAAATPKGVVDVAVERSVVVGVCALFEVCCVLEAEDKVGELGADVCGIILLLFFS